MKALILAAAFGLFSGDAFAAPDGGSPGACYRGGCSQELCTDRPGAVSPCIWKPQFRCYKTAACERQPNGSCDFTPTAELKQCLATEGAKKRAETDVQ
jgi:hypothetical protein